MQVPGWNRLAIRVRVAVVATASVAVALIVSGAILAFVQWQVLTSRTESAVVDRASDIAALIGGGQLPSELANRQGEESFIQIVGPGGEVVAASQNIAGAAPVSAPPPEGGDRLVFDVTGGPLGDDDRFRVAVRAVDLPGGRFTVYVGGSLEPVRDSNQVLLLGFAVGIPLLTVMVGFASWRLTGRALAPVEQIRDEVARISSESLERRVPVPEADDEVASLARTMNGMLTRLEEADTRQRRFVSDASHELRSPLASVRLTLEVATRDTSPEAHAAAVRTSLGDVVRLQSLVDDLLADAEVTDGPGRPVGPVDLDDLMFEEAGALPSGGRVRVDTSGVSSAQVKGDREQLRRAIRNLLQNAARYARTTVTVTLREEGDVARVVVADDGPGIPPGKLELIFERFGRVDESRDRQSGGTGLGLAITRAIVERHGGRVYATSTPQPQSGAVFVIELPLLMPAGPTPAGG